ncbi:hypothetical protein Q8791_23155 [Nocardiopsis sp. CT-R113]|uniref:Uncharacterized protein n=1 Tax=Nocardiopsis codii TaxID=3065942 RepID=A0ABU7KD15_9ACTN|nr:hypothetical protein [Nocardiopsis sp. CT-R113]MEE2040120.1 hypothetical protein [Nocardiopsis sp. CT-R113]
MSQYPVDQIIATIRANTAALRTKAERLQKEETQSYRDIIAELDADAPELAKVLTRAAKNLREHNYPDAYRQVTQVANALPWKARKPAPDESTDVRRLRDAAADAERLLALLEKIRDTHVSTSELERLGLLRFLRV